MRVEKTLFILIVILSAVAFAAVGTSISVLYRTSFEQQRARLTEFAQSQARLIEAIARFDAEFSVDHVEGGAAAATLSQVAEASRNSSGFGETGEYVLGKQEGDLIVFLLRQRHSGDGKPESIPLDGEFAEPMRLALRGLSGTVTAVDYRGEEVLAAYEPVAVLNIAIVAKIDLAEVRAPFVRAGAISAAVAFAAILIGALFFRAVVNPITQRMRRVMENLAEAQSLAHVGNWEWDISADKRTWSEETYRIFGQKPGDLPANYERFIGGVHPDDRALVEEASRLALEEGKPYRIDHRVVRPDGVERIVEERGRAFFDSSGKPIRLAGTIQDITERRAAGESLRKSEELRRQFMDSATESFVLYDSDLNFLDINKAALKSLGMRQEDVIGKNLADVLPASKESGRYEKYLSVLATGEPLHMEVIDVHPTRGELVKELKVFQVGDGLGMISQDVTERKTFERELRKERNFVTSVLDTSGAVAIVVDREGRVVRFNRACEIITGYTADEVVGRYVWDTVTAPEQVDDLKTLVANLDHEDPAAEHRSVWIARDGSRHIISMANSVIRNEVGEAEYMTAIGVDITARTKAEQALQVSNERFRSLYDNGVAGIAMSDLEGSLTEMNSAWCQMLGYSREEALGRRIIDMIHSDDVPAATRGRNQVLSGEIASYRDERRYLHKDGHDVWTLSSLAGIRDVDGNVQALIGVIQDISEIKAAEEALRQSEERLRMVIDNAPIMIWTTDRDGVLTMVEGSARPVVSGEAETVGRSMYDIRAHDPEVLEKLHGALGGETHSYVRDMSGHGLFETRIAPLRGPGGEVIGIVGVARDVVEEFRAKRELELLNAELEERVAGRTLELEKSRDQLKLNVVLLQQTQDQLVQSEKFASLGGLVAGVAHEINTPVGVAVTAASHLRDAAEGLNGNFREGRMKRVHLEDFLESADESTRIILGNLSRASDLVKSFKQVAVDQSSDELRQFNVAEYVREILLSLRPQLKKRGHNVTLGCDETLSIKSYPGALAQIITNFVLNSNVHAYPDDECGEIAIEIVVSNGRCELTYTDDGQGMPKDVVAKVFDPFFTTRRGKGGSGLGLNIVYNLVTQRLGGTINCASEVGFGTTFVVAFPVTEGACHDG